MKTKYLIAGAVVLVGGVLFYFYRQDKLKQQKGTLTPTLTPGTAAKTPPPAAPKKPKKPDNGQAQKPSAEQFFEDLINHAENDQSFSPDNCTRPEPPDYFGGHIV